MVAGTSGGVRVYVRRGSIILAGISFLGPSIGSSIVNGWTAKVDISAPDDAVAELIKMGITRSEFDVPMPNFRSGPSAEFQALLERSGTKSGGQLAKGAHLVMVHLADGVWHITPSHNEGGGTFTELSERAIDLQDPDDLTLVKTVRNAIEQCS